MDEGVGVAAISCCCCDALLRSRRLRAIAIAATATKPTSNKQPKIPPTMPPINATLTGEGAGSVAATSNDVSGKRLVVEELSAFVLVATLEVLIIVDDVDCAGDDPVVWELAVTF